jgi:hypothetical protein
MSLIGLPLELSEEVIDYAIPENWGMFPRMVVGT